VTETHEFVEREGKPTAEVWEIPRRVWFILLSWGLGVLVIASLLSWWIYRTNEQADQRAALVKLQQDRAMCAMIDIILSGPEPPAGPAGERARSVRSGMLAYEKTLDCP
jgi:hypothetical protein